MLSPTSFQVLLREVFPGAYLATVPALPGCVSTGESAEEALDHIRAAAEGYLEATRGWSDRIDANSLDLVLTEVEVEAPLLEIGERPKHAVLPSPSLRPLTANRTVEALESAGFLQLHVGDAHAYFALGHQVVTVPHHNRVIESAVLKVILDHSGLSPSDFSSRAESERTYASQGESPA